MFQPREIVYGLAKSIHDPHNKYMVTIYRDEELNIVACFTTSKTRAGVTEDKVHHGAIYQNRDCVSYVFEKGISIGVNPETGLEFSFPKRTTITFDYGVREGQLEFFIKQFDNPKVVCELYEKEYIELVYAMYSSPKTNIKYKNALEKVLTEYYSRQ